VILAVLVAAPDQLLCWLISIKGQRLFQPTRKKMLLLLVLPSCRRAVVTRYEVTTHGLEKNDVARRYKFSSCRRAVVMRCDYAWTGEQVSVGLDDDARTEWSPTPDPSRNVVVR